MKSNLIQPKSSTPAWPVLREGWQARLHALITLNSAMIAANISVDIRLSGVYQRRYFVYDIYGSRDVKPDLYVPPSLRSGRQPTSSSQAPDQHLHLGSQGHEGDDWKRS